MGGEEGEEGGEGGEGEEGMGIWEGVGVSVAFTWQRKAARARRKQSPNEEFGGNTVRNDVFEVKISVSDIFKQERAPISNMPGKLLMPVQLFIMSTCKRPVDAFSKSGCISYFFKFIAAPSKWKTGVCGCEITNNGQPV